MLYDKDYNMPSPNMPFQHKTCFKLKAIKKTANMERGLCRPPVCLKARNKFLFVKVYPLLLPVPGSKSNHTGDKRRHWDGPAQINLTKIILFFPLVYPVYLPSLNLTPLEAQIPFSSSHHVSPSLLSFVKMIQNPLDLTASLSLPSFLFQKSLLYM